MGAGKYARMMRRRAGSSCPSYVPGLYTAEEIDDLVNIDGYIPVASAAEFGFIDSASTQTMGAGTCWAGTYTTGVDKNYIQILPIDFLGSSTGITGITFTGIYDGNELNLTDYLLAVGGGAQYNIGLFATNNGTLKNIRANSISYTLLSSSNPSIWGGVCGTNNGTINNCSISNLTVTSTQSIETSTGSLCGKNSATGDIVSCFIQDCDINHGTSQGTTGQGFGLFCGDNLGTIESSYTTGVNIITSRKYQTAGFVGFNSGNIFDCYTNADVDTSALNPVSFVANNIGGFVASNTGTIYRCFATGFVDGYDNATLTGLNYGGFVGENSGGTIYQCYSTGNVNGSIQVGAFAGVIIGAGSITDCYAYGNAFAGNTSFGRSGGFAGAIRNGSANVTNCYSIGAATGTANGGFCGLLLTHTGTISASYWDTVASGNATSAAGTGQTTTDLQTPTSNTGIYSAWTIPPWDFGTSTDYPVLTTTP
jgi:hypothetical protein